MDYPIENCTGGGLNQLRRLLPRRVLTCLTRNPWPVLPRHGVAAPFPGYAGLTRCRVAVGPHRARRAILYPQLRQVLPVHGDLPGPGPVDRPW